MMPAAAGIIGLEGINMTDERLTDYLRSLERTQAPVIEEILARAKADRVPVIRPETAALLKVLIRLHRPMRLLEVGAAVGYSAVLMCSYMPEGGRITTIENYEKRIPIARENIRKAGMEEKITLLEGDAMEILPTLEAGFDMIFMDAAKAQYIHFLPQVTRLLKVGGLLVSDNVLQDGDIIESRFAVERRNRTIYKRMREYLWELKHSDIYETSVLTVGDGVTLSVKLKEAAGSVQPDAEG